MAVLRIFPARLDRRKAPEQLGPTEARQLQRLELVKRPGALDRGRGQVRAENVGVETSSVTSAAVVERADGVKELAYATLGGALRMQLGVEPAELD